MKETAYVIMRDDGKFFKGYKYYQSLTELDFVKTIHTAFLYPEKSYCEDEIEINDLQNCRPVKVEIKIVEE